MSQRTTGSLLSYALIGLKLVITLFMTLIMVSSLGQEGYGIFAIVGAMAVYLYILDFRINDSVLRFFVANENYYETHLIASEDTNFIVMVVRANVRVVWVNGPDSSGRIANALYLAASFVDCFVCVIKVILCSLHDAVPAAADKSLVIYNILDFEEMNLKATQGNDPFPVREGDVLCALMVCRLNERAKGLLRMVDVCNKLAEAGCIFRGYVGRDGADRKLLQVAISAVGQRERTVLIGNRSNPFPVYENADLVAKLSKYEGLCEAVNEARVLERPVVVNNEDAIFARMLSDDELRVKMSTGGYPEALLNDYAKLDIMESLFLARRRVW